MRALLIGTGSIGKRHARNLATLGITDLLVLRSGKGTASLDEVFAGKPIFYNLDEALAAQPDIAILANPASEHIHMAHRCAEGGCHLLIEKPLSNTLDGVNELISLCEAHHQALMVAYNFRFYPPLQHIKEAIVAGAIGRLLSIRAEVGQYLPDWRPGTDYRRCVSAQQSLGGGAVLELSHELDYVRWLVGAEVAAVSAQTARLSDLEIDVEDSADLLLQFTNGVLGNVHVDMVQRVPVRTCRIVGTEGTIFWNGINHQAQLLTGNTITDLAEPSDRSAMYVEELRHFLHCVSEGLTPAVTGEDGRRVLQIALAAKQAAQARKAIPL